ncbi:PHP domain-containing protein [Fusibacter sp. JL216-2]|uniref:PHP domain-containing protein n=1 Tax=Fusibacter sp. JL216-2 TaxID=3071453 RepID=UPI003D35471B
MRILSDYHTHTTYSHGIGTIEENVEAARKVGLKILAISDHGPGHMGFGIKKRKYKEMRQVIDEMNAKYDDIEVLLGLEANVLDVDGHLDVDEEILKLNDILLAGYHFGSRPVRLVRDMIHHANNYFSKEGVANKKLMEANTVSLINAMKRYDIDILTHPGAKGPIDVKRVAQVASETNTALEINASHGFLTLDQIKEAMAYDIKFSINSDAHHPRDIGNFKKAIDRANAAGLSYDRVINAVES